jgi:hypothetical protein
VTVGWVAATMRGRALLRRTTGVAGARAVAATPSWDAARDLLAGTVAGRGLPRDADRGGARSAASAATVWQLRVLAGWVPPASTGLVRLAAGPVEIADIEAHLDALEGGPRREPVPLGSLGTAWPALGRTTSAQAARDLLRRSSWGDPGGTDRISMALGLRVAWLRRIQVAAGRAAPWAGGALAVVVARERFAFERAISPVTGRDVDHALGRAWRAAGSLAELTDLLPPAARWPLAGIDRADDLWWAERAVAQRVAEEAGARAATGGADRATLVAVLALLLVDLWRVHAAIDLAGRGPAGAEAFDAVAA